MSESSPEKAQEPVVTEAAEASQASEQEAKTVPLKALASERAEKRAAREGEKAAKEKSQQLEQELAALKEKNPGLDMDQLASVIADVTSQTVKSAVDAELNPLRQQVATYESAMQHGLNRDQATALSKMKEETGLGDDRALAILKLEQPDLFPAQRPQQQQPNGFNPALFGGAPSGGNSMSRTAPDRPDYTAQMREAVENGDVGQGSKAQQAAIAAFKERILSKMPHLRIPSQ